MTDRIIKIERKMSTAKFNLQGESAKRIIAYLTLPHTVSLILAYATLLSAVLCN